MFRGLSFPLRPLTVETHLANAQSGDVMGLNGDWTSGYHNIGKELGYFSLNEINEAKGSLGTSIERDLYFKPTKLSQIKKAS